MKECRDVIYWKFFCRYWVAAEDFIWDASLISARYFRLKFFFHFFKYNN